MIILKCEYLMDKYYFYKVILNFPYFAMIKDLIINLNILIWIL